MLGPFSIWRRMHIGDLGQVNAAGRPYAAPNGRCWTNNGQTAVDGLIGSAANDPTATLAVHRGNGFDVGFHP
jgi:hypothetical protein